MTRSIEYKRWQVAAKTAISLSTVDEIHRLVQAEHDRTGLSFKAEPNSERNLDVRIRNAV